MTTLNINVGVLGHVDSGKTSLSKALSTVASTSAFDKNPQSKKRGITLDLGFSSFTVTGSHTLSSHALGGDATTTYDKIQFTLVDCPGHGSLIRTILCGAQIIDIMLLVIDVTKGFQTQTAECLVIGELTCDQLVVVLNKCDLLPQAERAMQIDKMRKRIWKTLEATKFRNAPIAVVSAAPAGVQVDGTLADRAFTSNADDVQSLIDLLLKTVTDPTARREVVRTADFLFAVDHCFTVAGQGTVMTGTVLSGAIRVGESVELPLQRIQRKIKSIQMFRQPVNKISPGDRAGLCVPQLDPGLLERGLVGTPSSTNLHPCHACVVGRVSKIAYFKLAVMSKARFHVFVGQETALARLTFFSLPSNSLDSDRAQSTDTPMEELDLDNPRVGGYEYLGELKHDSSGVAESMKRPTWVLLEFDKPFICPKAGLVIGARLDSTSLTACRLAFHGVIQTQLRGPDYKQTLLPRLPVFRRKSRRGQIERLIDARTCVVRGLFKRETNWDIFVGLRAHVVIEDDGGQSAMDAKGTGDVSERVLCRGHIESSFGQSGKCRLALDEELPEDVCNQFVKKSTKKITSALSTEAALPPPRAKLNVILEFKRFVFDPKRRIVQ